MSILLETTNAIISFVAIYIGTSYLYIDIRLYNNFLEKSMLFVGYLWTNSNKQERLTKPLILFQPFHAFFNCKISLVYVSLYYDEKCKLNFLCKDKLYIVPFALQTVLNNKYFNHHYLRCEKNFRAV